MRTLIIAILSLVVTGGAASANQPAPGRVEFEVLRNGQPFGRHAVTVTRRGDELVARTEVALRVAAGPVTLFRYEHECTETWSRQNLSGLDCATLRDGRRILVRAASRNGALHVAGANGDLVLPQEMRPTSWWVRPPAGADAMLDTESGARLPLRITNMGRETMTVAGQRIPVDHVRVQGTVTLDLWYDASGRWVGCAFTIRGQRIEYRLASPLAAVPAGATLA